MFSPGIPVSSLGIPVFSHVNGVRFLWVDANDKSITGWVFCVENGTNTGTNTEPRVRWTLGPFLSPQI